MIEPQDNESLPDKLQINDGESGEQNHIPQQQNLYRPRRDRWRCPLVEMEQFFC